jgi:hypothetical protein
VSGPGWYPDPQPGAPAGRLRWYDGRSWTNDLHPPASGPPAAAETVLEAGVTVVGPPASPGPGTRVFELTDGDGARLGRLVETVRNGGGGLGVALARAGAWQAATTRELRDARGWPQLVLTTSPLAPGSVVVTFPDRRQVGRIVAESGSAWGLVGHDGRRWGEVVVGRTITSWDGRLVGMLSEHGASAAVGWRISLEPVEEPMRMLARAAGLVADAL